MERFDVVIAGAGAAGMMCAIEAGRRGRSVLVIDHAAKPGEKIRISGGGRCNFTNREADRIERYLSKNPRFAISALSRYRPADFIAMVERHGIAWHEKTLGQLFCDGSATQIIDMLLAEMTAVGAVLRMNATVDRIERAGEGFELAVGGGRIGCEALVIATGGKSILKMGASGFAYDVARRFGLAVTETRPALVPLTFDVSLLEKTKGLSGVALEVVARAGKARFREAMLFTHRGLSGPAILQVSSHWREGEAIEVDMAPDIGVFDGLKAAKSSHPKQTVATALGQWLPLRLAHAVADWRQAPGRLADTPDQTLRAVAEAVNRWRVKPVGSEGYRTAEVTLGGIDTAGLDSRTMQARSTTGLFFVGEAVDVTGWLGGYNFQWAWASGWAAGQAC